MIHDIRHSFGSVISKVISIFDAFTGCDVLSAFHGKGKRATFQTWNMDPEAAEVFAKLSMYQQVTGATKSWLLKDEASLCMTGLVLLLILNVSNWTWLPASRSHTMQYPQPVPH